MPNINSNSNSNLNESEISKVLQMLLKDLQDYQNNPEFLKAMYQRKLLEYTIKPMFRWLLPQVQAFQGPYLPSTIRGFTQDVLNQFKIYDNQLAFGTAEYLYNLKFGTDPKGLISNDLFEKFVEKAQYDLVDYVYYIFLPLKYKEYNEFFSRWTQFAKDIKKAQDRKKFSFANLRNFRSRNAQAGQFFHSVANKKREILANELMSAISHNCYDIKVLAIDSQLMSLEKEDYNLGISADPKYTVQGVLSKAQKLSGENFQMMDFLKRFAAESKASINFLKEKGTNLGLLIENIDQKLVELENEIDKSMKDLEILIEANEEYLNQEYKKKFKQHQDRSNRNRNRRNPPGKRSAKLKVHPTSTDQGNLNFPTNNRYRLSIKPRRSKRPMWSKNPMGKSKNGSGRPSIPPGGAQIKMKIKEHFQKYEVLYLVILTILFIFINGIKLFPTRTSPSLLQDSEILKKIDCLDCLLKEKGLKLTFTNLPDKNTFIQFVKRKLKGLTEDLISQSDLESIIKYVEDGITEELIEQSLKIKNLKK